MNNVKQSDIINMFDNIANSYDIANRILSFGVDIKWRREACKLSIKLLKSIFSNNLDSIHILDMACGSGDMILSWLKHFKPNQIIGIDPSINMLNIAKNKLPFNVELIQGEAAKIKLEDESIDLISIAYGLRNIIELDLALNEFKRILKKNGILVILEFTKKDRNSLLDSLALFYTSRILPLIGGLVSSNYEAYKYLPKSVEGFLTLESLENKFINLDFTIEIKKRYIANLCSLVIVRKN